MLRLLFDTQAIALLIKLCYAISFWIAYTITKDGCLVILLCISNSLCQDLVQSCAIEDIVTQHEASRIITNELLSDDECLSQAIGRRLLGILELHSKLTSVT